MDDCLACEFELLFLILRFIVRQRLSFAFTFLNSSAFLHR